VDAIGDETSAPLASTPADRADPSRRQLDPPRADDRPVDNRAADNRAAEKRPAENRANPITGKGIEWPFDTLPEAIEWWYRPVLEAQSWLALAYLFVGLILGPVFFALTVATVATTSALMAVGIGLLLVVPAFAFVDALTAVHRHLASWVSNTIPARRLDPSSGLGWSAISTRLHDANRWRQVSFLLVSLVSGPVFFVIGFLPWSLLLGGPFGFGSFSIGRLLASAALLGVGPRFTRFVADVAVSFSAWFLGPDPSELLEERVEELSTQREQILDAVAAERRRIERNLHDGVQQQLVALGIDIGRAHARLDADPEGAKELLGEARDKVRGSIGELRLIGRGLHPAVLSDRGLDAALSAVVANAPIPISVDVATTHELPTDVAETSYYVVNEAVANVLKHARARTASVRVHDEPGLLPAIRIVVHDDGRGGADATRSSGSGLAGIAARVTGVDGVFEVDSPTGGPTTLTAVIPIRRPRLTDAPATDTITDTISRRPDAPEGPSA
jgi:signal transduction histidine kinase